MSSRRLPFKEHCVKEDRASAVAYLERASGELEATVRDALRGYIAHSEGDRSRALEFAKCAESEISSATAPETKELLARLFMMADQLWIRRCRSSLELFESSTTNHLTAVSSWIVLRDFTGMTS